MIYITGDIHGNPNKLSNAKLAQRGIKLTKNDVAIIAGDFGLPWVKNAKDEKYWLDWLAEKPFTTAFIDGNHENFPLLATFREKRWKGGLVHVLNRRVIHLQRGQIYNIAGTKVFTMGGAASHDKQWRTEGKTWWPEELPLYDEMDKATKALETVENKIDIIVTHCAPTSIQAKIDSSYTPDRFTEYLQYVAEQTEFKHWYFGHYHQDKRIDDKFTVVYDDVILLE